jgi:F0F1-type ATP synthase membrane subunit b/b'
MASSPRLCETFLKRSWHRAATVFAALIALNGLPVEDAQARSLAAQAPAAQAAPAQTQPRPAADHAAPAPTQAAPAQPVEKDAHPAAPAAETPHAAPAQPAADHAPAAADPAAAAGHDQPPAHGPPAAGSEHGDAGASHGAAAGSHGSGQAHEEKTLLQTVGPYINFLILVGGLVYFLKTPVAHYLATRSQQIRGGLESARETTDRATARLAELDQRLQSLPAELEALRRKGVEEIAAEERRIQAQAEVEKKRLVDDVQRDIDVRVRVARKQLAEHAADLAVGLAADRVRQTITDADQARLIDRYADQVKDIHG